MPMSYRIDSENNLILTTATGVLTDDDVLLLKEKLWGDKQYRPGMRELSDIRGIEKLEVTPEGVRAMVQADRQHPEAVRNHKLALVVNQDVVYGMGRMYQMMVESTMENMRVFRDLDEALDWLGLQPGPSAD